jgi:hypothetical protein
MQRGCDTGSECGYLATCPDCDRCDSCCLCAEACPDCGMVWEACWCEGESVCACCDADTSNGECKTCRFEARDGWSSLGIGATTVTYCTVHDLAMREGE